jgi:hypothetical protein
VKKPAALFLLNIFLFNVVGYYGIYIGLVHKADRTANHEIENNSYDQSQTITIKIPLTLPYPVQGEFERASGDFEHQGEFYKLVQQKYENDTVYIVCLKNTEKKHAMSVLKDMVKQTTDQSSSSNHQGSKILSGLLKDFNPVTSEILVQAPESLAQAKQFISIEHKILTQEFPVPTPPPNGNC